MGDMSHFDPTGGLGNAGYEKATTNHAATLIGHLKSVGMTPQSPGAKQVADGIHKAAMDRLFNPMKSVSGLGSVNSGSGTLGSGTGSNSSSTAPMARGTSSGYMVGGGGQ